MAGYEKYKLISPGVAIQEIDNSQTPKKSDKIGPIVIGRAQRGPGMRPVKVESFSEWVQIFGDPVAGGQGGDVWREGNKTAPMYGAYAAQAYLRNNSPLTYVRLLGTQHTNATTAGEAGFETKDAAGVSNGLDNVDAGGGAYGLFIIDSGSGDSLGSTRDPAPTTGALAAVWYFNEGSITLTGSSRSNTSTATASGSAILIKSLGSNKEFKAIIRNAQGNVVNTTTFNFNINSPKYIRKVFNTNPTLTNPDISLGANTASYWLGQTYERHLDTYVTGGTGENYGIILGLKGDSGTKEGGDFRFGAQAAQSGWFFSQDLSVVSGGSNSYQPQSMTKLFKFHCLDTGEWTQQNIKISIQDIKASTNPADPYGTFTVILRRAQDSDNSIQAIERYSGCNLNPNSINYIARKIGDRYVTWDDTDRRFREYGNYDNRSKFVRVEMNTDVQAGGVNVEVLPFGVFGPIRPLGFAIIGGADAFQNYGVSADGNDFSAAFVKGATGDICRSGVTGSDVVNAGSSSLGYHTYTGSFLFPSLPLRVSSSDGNLSNPQDAYFGISTALNNSTTRFDVGYGDLIRPLPVGFDTFAATAGETEHSFIFSLDDLSGSSLSSLHAVYVSGSRAAGTSITAADATNYKKVLTSGFDRFTAPLFGGFDGLDITEKEPFNNTDLEGGTELTNYAYNSVKRAVDSVRDPEVVESNVMAMPGITNESLTLHMLNVCEERADSLAIIDLKGGFIPSTENTNGDNAAGNRGDVDTTISNLQQRGINSSYGCAYYPWVQIRDTVNDAVLWAPPSIVALGTMGSSETKSEIWFAPAGFTRGGLTEGSAGVPVLGVREQLTVKQRDKLYAANINPIAKFPNEGIVIFGNKTLQVTPSALDRINVRRLLIYLKKEVSRMAATILFSQNTKETWARFRSKVEPFMRSVQVRLGVTEWLFKLDESTTDASAIDQNLLYAILYLKPAKSIEFIAIDFNITNSGASFAD